MLFVFLSVAKSEEVTLLLNKNTNLKNRRVWKAVKHKT